MLLPPKSLGRLSFGASLGLALFAPALAMAQDAADSPAAVVAPAKNGVPRPLDAHIVPPVDPTVVLPETKPHPNAAAGLAMPYAGRPVDVSTYHYDGSRTGWNQRETVLTPANVASTQFGLLTTLNVDGNVLAQPLIVSNFVMPDGSRHNILVVATGHNSVYAFDAQSYAPLWQVNLGTSQSSTDIGCGDVEPEYGISATPVIVRSAANAAKIYVVSATEPQSMSFHTQIHALDLGTGADVTPPVEIAPTATLSNGSTIALDQQNEWSRAGLAYGSGSIYVTIGSHCDHNPAAISGWVLRYGTALKLRSTFSTILTPASYQLAGIWMTGFAPAVDASGNLFVVTGNGNFAAGGDYGDYGESALRLAPSIKKVQDYFTPASYLTLNNSDVDFGSGGIMLLPNQAGQTAPPLAVAMGKDATLYLLDQTNLGGMTANDAGALQATRVASTGKGVWGGPAYYSGAAGSFVYYQTSSDVLRSYSVAAGTKPSLTLSAQGTSTAGFGGSLPIVSSNGAAANTAVVWLVRRSQTVKLEAYDAVLLGTPLYSANAGTWSNSHGNAFVTPLEANGRVYVPAYKTVTVFGLTP